MTSFSLYGCLEDVSKSREVLLRYMEKKSIMNGEVNFSIRHFKGKYSSPPSQHFVSKIHVFDLFKVVRFSFGYPLLASPYQPILAEFSANLQTNCLF